MRAVVFGRLLSGADTEVRAVVEQACQPVRQSGVDERFDKLSEGRKLPWGVRGTAASSELDRQTWRSVATIGRTRRSAIPLLWIWVA